MNLITENTGLTVGVVAIIGGAIWWASAMQAKLDQLLTLVAAQNLSHEKLRAELDALRDRVTKLEAKK